jgi:pyruvate/2-oxoglutarate dehydrogenase complex dihydrolipoamide dehydrogenase (E3) component
MSMKPTSKPSLAVPGDITETPDPQGAYPRLSDAQVAALTGQGDRRGAQPGEILFREGERDCDFYVVLAGHMASVEGHGTHEERILSVHGCGRFLGELSLLTGEGSFCAAIAQDSGCYRVRLADGTSLASTSVVIATGARYRRLDVPRLDYFEKMSVYYAASQAEALMCRRDPVAIVGGGNSAGQAAIFLSAHAVRITLIVREHDLGEHMSRYLVDQVTRLPNVEVMVDSEVRELHGGPGGTGPLPLETNRPAVFAVGDVRSGSAKRVAAAVGEGAMAIRLAFERTRPA